MSENGIAANGDLSHKPNPQQSSQITANNTSTGSPLTIDADLAMALRISEQEQKQLQEDLKREQQMLEEVLRLSLEEK